MANSDPFYNRKPVPDEFIEHVGYTGLTKQEEHLNRERKYSKDGGDVRKFWNPKSKDGTPDPHYARKRLSNDMIAGVGDTGLTPEEEFLNRERKMSVNGVDVRKFSKSSTGGMEPQGDPYYGRKPVAGKKSQMNNNHKTDKYLLAAQISDVGDTGYSKAEEYEQRERKQSMFQESSDPFQQFSGKGHRQSVSDQAGPGAAYARRKSSALAPDAMAAATHHHTNAPGAHSGYGGETLTAIESRNEFPGTQTSNFAQPSTTTTTTTTTTSSSHVAGDSQHGLYHDTVTHEDPDSVGPRDVR